MHTRIDVVAASAPARLLPVESIRSRRQAQEEHAGLAREREPAASFASRPDPGSNTYAAPSDATAGHSAFVTPDPVAPALAQALAAEPWGHPMPQKAMWEQANAARTPKPEPVEAAATVASATPSPATAETPSEPTPVVTTAAAPATRAAATAAPVSSAWLTSLLKAR